MKHNILEQLGLNDNESIVYNILLSEGPKTPPELAGSTGITRANAYFVLQALIGKGLVERKDRKKKFLYYPLDPSNLVDIVKREKQEIHEKERVLTAILPELTGMYNMHTNKPSVSYFEGIAGVKTLYNDSILQKPEEMLVFRSPLDDEFLGKDFAEKQAVKMKNVGIQLRMISPETKPGVFTEVNGERMLREVRYIKKHLFESEISIYNNRVAIVTYGKTKVSMLIENKELANTLRSIFEVVWTGLK